MNTHTLFIISPFYAGKEAKSSGASSKMSFLPSLNPRTWGKFSSGTSTDRPVLPKVGLSKVGQSRIMTKLTKHVRLK